MDFVRHGFLARALRGQVMMDTAKLEWEKALKAVSGSRQGLVMLLGMAIQWNWPREQEELVTVHGVKRMVLEELLSVVESGVRKYPATEKEQDAH